MTATLVLVLALVGALVYVLYVRSQRYKNLEHILSLDPKRDYFKICNLISFIEFPFTSQKADEFSLFRTYGVPSISRLLHKTQQFCPKSVGKRYDDTQLLILEFAERSGERAETAIKRLNYLHSNYTIDNEDYLYVLSLFVVQKVKWINSVEWRCLSGNEVDALFYFWIDIGKKMGIQDLPKSYKQMIKMNEDYERRNMFFEPQNRSIANSTVDLLLSKIPYPFKYIGYFAAESLMDERLLDAVGYSKIPYLLGSFLTWNLLKLRGYLVRYLCLPRSAPRHRTSDHRDPKTGLISCRFHVYEKIYPEGYRTEDLGPFGKGKLGNIHT